MSASGSDASQQEALATVELLGALTYAQLRAFALAAASVQQAPDVRTAHELAGIATREHASYLTLRERLTQLTELAEPPMERQKARIDAFFDHLPVEDWMSACTFFAVGLPIAADFARAVAPALDDETADAVLRSLAERDAFERFAIREAAALVGQNEQYQDRVRHIAAEVTGSALTEFQGAITDTDALLVLLERLSEDAEPDVLRRTAVGLLEQHHRRMAAIGLDTPE